MCKLVRFDYIFWFDIKSLKLSLSSLSEFLKVSPLSPLQCKAQFLSILSKWPLFGSSFFAVKRVFGDDIGAVPDDDSSAVYRELILALNYRGVLFLDSNTHDTLHHWNFIEIISTRKVSHQKVGSVPM